MVCGSGSTGKSTFCRASINRFLADQASLRDVSESRSGVLLLDLDLMQPELTPPGLMCLAHVKTELFGPPDSHLAIPGSSQSRILRMHYLGEADVDSVSNVCTNAVKDLLQYLDAVRKDYPGCEVLINSSSWLIDLESTQLSNLVSTMRPSDIIYFDSSGSLKHREVLARSMGEKCNLWGLASKVYRSAPASTIRWSYMQSYFHLVSSKRAEPTWDRFALLSPNKKELAYTGPESMIWAVVTLRERLALENVAQALEDSIVAIVAVKTEESYGAQANRVQDESPGQFSGHVAPTIPDMLDDQQIDPAGIVRTEVENLPYLQDFNSETNLLHPARSECLGLAYITAINPVREIIEIVTPISQQIMTTQRDSGFRLAIVMVKQACRWTPVHGLI